MSITLDIRPYCHNCEKFEPEVWTEQVFTGSLSLACTIETKVRCVNRNKCEKIEDYIREQIRKEED